ncbi:MAG TPA: ribose-phosphate diphosphokinase [Paraburkholderia sp.]|uniref:ribose-phosphate diphosphokinase n=1 Tax=Paraburkholderia sp. TaxID=1926495 RepID=UPI002B49FE65|nr:ribose-phosphate diphosphokinase [Paraburkholderia sp.]HKR42624.1 ribose-phosphate diphosphokinase [Paraburkholderia sp.]
MIQVTAVSRAAGCQPVELKTVKFPGGEMHVTVGVDVPADELLIVAHLPDSAAVMTLLMATDALRRAYMDIPVALAMPYVPYARQDRVANAGEALSIKVFCDIINAQRYSRVTIQDPHSDVVAALLERVVIDDPLPALRRAVASVGTCPTLVAPDAGARKRVFKLAKALELDVVFADKTRDTRTGAIAGTKVQDDLPDTPLLVVDDICDGGRTFTELADALCERQAAQGIDRDLYLYVTHGIFSKGLDPLLTRYAAVFARNNWTDDSRCVLV